MTQNKQKYKKGDRVKVKYGHVLWSNQKEFQDRLGKPIGKDENGTTYYDTWPQLAEDTATVEYTYGEKSETDWKFSKGDDGYKRYCLKFDKHGEISWFDEDHLIPVNEQP